MKKRFKLEGLECANCAAKMERAINELDGVKEATVNFMTQKLVIEGEDEKMPTIIEEAEKVVKDIESHVIMKKA
ncbi:heavy metal transporter [Listeria monocytogenes]|jgi:copper chaperone CopZ|uniref:Heavy metal transporter n=2 Tax=Bacillota TaxID=1239 RepID=A0ABX1VMI7_9FIRM|nr:MULTISPECIES: cation transporter [Bacillota]EAC2243961.1 heavy metal transporter [Listeria monocytogenes]EFR90515.1 cadmium, zinc and cobalt-transporting ATPase [Listeria innocua FSL S4-378]ELD8032072.1 cation transporter [Listeria innocua]HAS74563.1 heavy metal transporter [Clostridiales bacterium UBA8960]EAC2244113.1 heavy metal transporter [Listeria monocytogenes]|tara:strand:+ start:861 stop:1082 length:222 start_codon:yes stop_codon:yes gene_type:complete